MQPCTTSKLRDMQVSCTARRNERLSSDGFIRSESGIRKTFRKIQNHLWTANASVRPTCFSSGRPGVCSHQLAVSNRLKRSSHSWPLRWFTLRSTPRETAYSSGTRCQPHYVHEHTVKQASPSCRMVKADAVLAPAGRLRFACVAEFSAAVYATIIRYSIVTHRSTAPISKTIPVRKAACAAQRSSSCSCCSGACIHQPEST